MLMPHPLGEIRVGRKILVVEDFDALRDVYEIFLSRDGYQVATVANGLEAIDALRNDTPDLILLDMLLPHVSGWDLLRFIRGIPKWQGIPVIVVSALSEAPNVAQGWSLGCTSYLEKPVDMEDLCLLVNRILENPPAPTPAHPASFERKRLVPAG